MTSYSKWIPASRDEPVFDVAERSLRARLGAVEHFLPLAAHQAHESIEHVHQLRVWSRRATAAIRLYRDLCPWVRSGRVKKQLTKIRRAANDARDADVLLLRLEKDQNEPGAARLLERARKHRAQSQQPLVAIFDKMESGDRFRRQMENLLSSLRERAQSNALRSARFGPWARANLRPYLDQFFHDGQAPLSDLGALHQFRISGKKLRYTMELLAAAFPLRFAKRLYPKIESLQERLGEINDLATAQLRYRHWLEEAESESEVEYIRGLLADEEDRLRRCREAFSAWWKPPRVRRLAKAFHDIIRPRKRCLPATNHAFSGEK